MRGQDNPDSIRALIRLGGWDRAQEPVLAQQRAMEADRASSADGCPRGGARGRSTGHQRHRACSQEWLPLVRLPARIWSADDDL